MSDPFADFRKFKVVVSFYPIGSAPRLKVSKFTVDGTLRMGELTNYLGKIIKESDVHLYVSNSIELMEDQVIGDFVKIFGKLSVDESQGTINIHYSVGRAYL
jgi:hypothetical protein